MTFGALVSALVLLLGAGAARAADMQVISGRYVGTGGASNRAITGVGFKSDLVMIKSSAGQPTVVRTSTMSGDAAKELGTASALKTGCIRSLDNDGFTVGTNAAVNTAGVTYYWTAFKSAGGKLAVGSYTGNLTDNRAINASLQPAYVMIMAASAQHAVQRFATEVGDSSMNFNGAPEAPDLIQSFLSTGFRVGVNAAVNVSGTTYHYVAFAATAAKIAQGSFVGDGVDDRAIVAGLRPQLMFLGRQEPGVPTVARFTSTPGDLTFPMAADTGFANGVQSLRPDGFAVGTDERVNAAGNRYHWVAFQNAASYDLDVTCTANRTRANAGDTLTYTVRVTDFGPTAVTTLQVTSLLPTTLTLLSSTASQGAYAPANGRWTVGAMATGAMSELTLVARVNAGTAGTTIAHRAAITASDLTDLYAKNNVDTSLVRIPLTGLATDIQVDDATPVTGETVNATVTLANAGPDSAYGVAAGVTIPAGLAFVAATPSQGSYDQTSGTWTIGAVLPGQPPTLALRLAVTGAAGSQPTFSARVTASDAADATPLDDADSTSVTVMSGEVRVVSGSYVGDGAASRAITGIGFQPDLVVLGSAAATATVVRAKPMAGVKELGSASALLAGRITALDRDGFTVGSDASVNQSGATYYWTAFLESPGRVKLGAYTGDASDDRAVTGVGFRPDYVMVLGAGATFPVQRFDAEAGDASLGFVAGTESTDRIQRLDPDGFQVGASAEVNASGTSYVYAAWGTSPGVTSQGAYTGDGADGRDVASPGLRPQIVFVARQAGLSPTVWRNQPIVGDLTLPATAAAGFANAVQSLDPLGFNAGSDATVNAAGDTYFFAAFRDGHGADLDVRAAVGRATAREGDSLTLAVRVANHGPLDATSVQITHALPAGLTLLAPTVSQGTFAGGVWDVGGLAFGDSATMSLLVQVDAGTAGQNLVHHATVTASAPIDLDTGNDTDSATVRIPLADLGLTVSPDDATPVGTEPVTFTVRLTDVGPDATTGVVAHVTLPAGLTYAASQASAGTFDSGTGTWSLGSLDSGAVATLAVTATPGAGTTDSTLAVTAAIIASDERDNVAANDSATTSVTVFPALVRVVSGSYVGDGGPAHGITGVGFQPDLVVLKATTTSAATQVRTKPMSGTKELGSSATLAANRILALDRDGFTVGSDATVNQSGVTYDYTAFIETPGAMKVGVYSGDASDDRAITGVGFQPTYLMVLGAGASAARQRFGAESGDASLAFAAGGEVPDRIQRLDADGFQVGGAADVNAAGVSYFYAGWSATASITSQGTYAGDGADDRSVTQPGLRPQHLFVARQDGATPTVWRNRAVAGDLTLPAVGAAGFANGIQRFQSAGFEAGSDAAVNAAGASYFYAALRSGAGADLTVQASADRPTAIEGDSVTLALTVTNHGPGSAGAVLMRHQASAGFAVLQRTLSQGTLDTTSGDWSIGSLAAGASATLSFVTTVRAGTAGTTLLHDGRILSSTPADPFTDDNADTAGVLIPLADLDVTLTADDLTPIENELVTFTVKLTDRGPDAVDAVTASALLPSGLVYLTSQASAGTYDEGTGVWSVGGLASGAFATLAITAAPGAGTADSERVMSASILTAAAKDPVSTNDAATVTTRPQQGGSRFVMGTYVGSGAASRHITGVGFQPDLLIIKGTNNAAPVARTKWMATDAAKELGTSSPLLGGRVQSLDLDGFTVGSDAGVNQFGVTYYWTAFLETPGQMKIGLYTGNGTDNRSVSGLGFQPGYVMVLGANAKPAIQRFAPEAGDASLPFSAGGEVADRIQRLDVDGFQVGTGAEVNASGTTYFYAAWNSAFDRVQTGLYLGNGADDRSVTGVGFRPSQLLVKRQDNAATVTHTTTMSGDLSLPLAAGFSLANSIQSFVSDGFQVGTDATANQSGRVYFYTAFRDQPSLDLAVSQAVSDSIPDEGETVTFTVKLVNRGPEEATGVALTDALPAGLVYQTHVPSRGVYDSRTHVWSIGSVVTGDSATLAITASVGPGTAGSVLAHTMAVTALDQSDSNNQNDASTVTIRIPVVDLGVQLAVDHRLPREEDLVTYTVTVKNAGPDPASQVVVYDHLPSGLTFASATASHGVYDEATGLWSVPALARGDSAQLTLGATVDLGTGGLTIENVASIVDAEQADTTGSNESDSVTVVVALGPGLQVTTSRDTSIARPGRPGARLTTVTFLNSSAEACTLQRVAFANQTSGPGTVPQLDAELGVVAAHLDDGDGVFDPATDPLVEATVAANGAVVFDSLGIGIASGTLVQIHVTSDVAVSARDGDALGLGIVGPGDVRFDRAVTFLNGWPITTTGRVNVDGMSAAQITSRPLTVGMVPAGSRRQLAFDVLLPANGYAPDIVRALEFSNLGDAVPGSDIQTVEVWGDGNNGLFDGGNPDDFPIGVAAWNGAAWAISGLTLPVPSEGRRLFVSVDVRDSAVAGRTIRLGLAAGTDAVRMESTNDGPVDTLVAGSELRIDPGPSLLRLDVAQTALTLLPGQAAVSVLRFAIANVSASPETLTTVSLSNTSTGPGTATQLDREWLPLALEVDGAVIATSTFAARRAAFTNLGLVIAAGDTLDAVVSSGASTNARDGDLLDLGFASIADLAFSRAVRLVADGSLGPQGSFLVDGMSAAQVALGSSVPATMLTGSTRNLALDVVVPGNGYTSDVLQFLLVRNAGTAAPLTEVTRVEAWSDDGDGVFEPAGASPDHLLGPMSFTGGDWALGGFSAAVPDTGLRVFFSCDIARDAFDGGTVRLVIPSTPIPGIGVTSGNDGPRDQSVESLEEATLVTQDHIKIVSAAIDPGFAWPGTPGVELLHLTLRNTYADSSRTLTGVTVTNRTTGQSGATRAELDGEIQSLELRSGATVLGTATFSNGRAAFGGFSLPLAPGVAQDLSVVAQVAVAGAADGDVLGAELVDATGVAFAESVTFSARFPLNSGAATVVDGMAAAQIQTAAATDTTLGPSEGPVLALDFTIPRNGYANDVLRQVELLNAGTARPADLTDVHLWRDGGNGAWDRGAGDDRDLGALTYVGGRWTSAILTEGLGAAGAHLFATVTTSATPVDSALVQLAVPLDGISVGSGNDGPNDDVRLGPTTILLSRSQLLASLEILPGQSVVGDPVTVRMTVRNTSAAPLVGVRPGALELTGAGTLTPGGGVTPDSLDLAPDSVGVFTWTFVAATAGAVQAAGAASGAEVGSGFVHRSLAVTATHHVFARPTTLDAGVIESMPFSIARGQTQVVPLTVTLTHPGDASVANIDFHRLTLRLEDESGNGVIPSALLSRIAVREGTTVLAQQTALPATGASVDLVLDSPLTLASSGAGSQRTLIVTLDVSDTTRISSFRLVLPDTGSLSAASAVNGDGVAIHLQAPAAFPFRSGLARIVAGATELDVAPVAAADRSANRGQPNVGLVTVTLVNPGPVDLGPDVRLSAFSVVLVDGAGQPVDATQVLGRIRVTSPTRTLVDRPIVAQDASSIAIVMSPPLSVPINTPVPVQIAADLAAGAGLGTIHLRLADSTSFTASNSSTGAVVPARFSISPIEGPAITIQSPADTLRVLAQPHLAGPVAVGATDVHVTNFVLRHPSAAGTAAIRLDQLSLRCRDQLGRLLSPASVIKRATLYFDDQPRDSVIDVPTAAGAWTIPLTNAVITGGAISRLAIHCNIEASAPAGFFELSLAEDGVFARDVNSAQVVAAAADSGADFPLSSGFVELQAPARELSVGFGESMPALLAATNGLTTVATLSFRNRSPAGEIRIDHLDLVAADPSYGALAIGDACTHLEMWIGDTLWAGADLAPGDTVVRLAGADVIAARAGTPVVASIRVAARANDPGRGFRIGCRRQDVGVVQPSSPLLFVSVSSDEGQTFPFWTSAGAVSASTLRESYANFPNPFAAGRGSTAFTYVLAQDARVTLEIWTARGEKVATLASGAPRVAGLHLDDRWDGRNGNGQTVTNGVYLARLLVQYADGTSDRILRKVAVAR